MPRTARSKSINGIYHVMLRGVNRQEIFHDGQDNQKFLEILKKYKEESGTSIFAWCLMGNHVHLLLKEGPEGVSLTMKRIGVSYASYYNWKYRTSGHLFQDRFKSENVDSIRYFLTVIRYIHQNPVKAGVVQQPDRWKWSSCSGYYGQPYFPGQLLDKEMALSMFSNEEAIAAEKFREFNEQSNDDVCMKENEGDRISRLTDEEARMELSKLLGGTSIVKVKTMPKKEKTVIFQEIKKIKGLSTRQAARILGVSTALIYKYRLR